MLTDTDYDTIITRRGEWESYDYPNFKFHEAICRCNSGRCASPVHVRKALIDLLQMIRYDFGKRMVLSSVTRCRNHPITIAKFNNRGKAGSHYDGSAADILLDNREDYNRIKDIAIRYGARGIGDGSNLITPFIHVDVWKERKRLTYWSYKNAKYFTSHKNK